MSIIKEFREFAMRGNVVDLAVGVIIGAAFGKIVSSLVADIIMPPLGLLIGGIDFKQFAVTLRDAQGDIPAVVMHYGVFIQNVFDFLIVAFAIFMAIKLINNESVCRVLASMPHCSWFLSNAVFDYVHPYVHSFFWCYPRN